MQEQKVNQESCQTIKFHLLLNFKMTENMKGHVQRHTNTHLLNWFIIFSFARDEETETQRLLLTRSRGLSSAKSWLKVSAISSRIMELEELKMEREWIKFCARHYILDSTGAYVNVFCRNRKIMLEWKLYFF